MKEPAVDAVRVCERSELSPRSAERGLQDLASVQRQILNQSPPSVPAYRLELAYHPAYFATGDYHDFFQLPEGHAIFVGDGSGHGPVASILMVTMRTILHTHRHLHGDPGNALSGACRLFHPLIPSDRFMTGVYLLLGDDGKVRWASAGHHPPLWTQRSGEMRAFDHADIGLPLAALPDEIYRTVTWQLAPGDRLLLFTDGLVEARNRAGEPFGRQRLQELCRDLRTVSLRDLIGEVLDQADKHLAGVEFEDDFTLVAVEHTG